MIPYAVSAYGIFLMVYRIKSIYQFLIGVYFNLIIPRTADNLPE